MVDYNDGLNTVFFINGSRFDIINTNQSTRGSQSNVLWTITVITLAITKHGRRVCRRKLRRNEVKFTI